MTQEATKLKIKIKIKKVKKNSGNMLSYYICEDSVLFLFKD